MVEKVTRMMVKVDLQCSRCCKKIKKILCKFPQIGDRVYDYKLNAVFITVVCCSPEKIRDKIICKGGDTVLGVEILPEKKPEPPKEQEKKPDKPKEQPKEQEKKPEKPKEPEKPEKPKEPEKKPEKPKEPEKKAEKPKEPKDPEKPPAAKPTPVPTPTPAPAPAPPTKPPAPAPQPAPALPPPNVPQPVQGCPPMYPVVGVCWCPCYEGCGGGPCYCQGQGRPVMCSDGCGRPAYECQGGSRAYCASRCDYFNEENATGCIVM